jgi:CheY-like chemotaxis protein
LTFLCAGAPEQFPTTTFTEQLLETGSKNEGADIAAKASQIVEPSSGDYSCTMSDKLTALLERLKAHQTDLILAMAEHDGMPAGSALRQVAELENVIAAIEAVADEEAERQRRNG